MTKHILYPWNWSKMHPLNIKQNIRLKTSNIWRKKIWKILPRWRGRSPEWRSVAASSWVWATSWSNKDSQIGKNIKTEETEETLSTTEKCSTDRSSHSFLPNFLSPLFHSFWQLRSFNDLQVTNSSLKLSSLRYKNIFRSR
jgi:hypothetical protein